jgi:hypothetical protein
MGLWISVLSALLGISQVFFCGVSFAEVDIAGSSCGAESLESSASFTSWLRSLDRLGDFAMRQPDVGDHTLASGAIVGADCISGVNLPLREELIEKFEGSLSRAFQQIERCQNVLNLPNLSSAVSVLRRTRFSCPTNLPDRFVASNMVVRRCSSLAPFGYVSSTYDRSHAINFPSDRILRLPEEEMATYLLHEALHSTASNHRAWHNDIQKRSEEGCTDSLYLDRVYLTSVACFPRSSRGSSFFRAAEGAYQCPGLCERTFTEVDPDLGYERATGFLSTGVIGPPLLATPLGRTEASLICNRVRNIRTEYLGLQREREAIWSRFQLLRTSSFLPPASTPDNARFHASVAALFWRADSAFSPGADFDFILRELTSGGRSLRETITQACSTSPRLSGWERLCQVDGEPIFSALEQYTAVVRSVQSRHAAALRGRAPTPGEVMVFFGQ